MCHICVWLRPHLALQDRAHSRRLCPSGSRFLYPMAGEYLCPLCGRVGLPPFPRACTVPSVSDGGPHSAGDTVCDEHRLSVVFVGRIVIPPVKTVRNGGGASALTRHGADTPEGEGGFVRMSHCWGAPVTGADTPKKQVLCARRRHTHADGPCHPSDV